MATLVCTGCGRQYTTNKPPTPGKEHRCQACGGLLAVQNGPPAAPAAPPPLPPSPAPPPSAPPDAPVPAPPADAKPDPAGAARPGPLPVVAPEERTFGAYRIRRVLGRGGMGVVYDAVHAETGDRVALKTLLANPNEVRRDADRFLREIRLGMTLPPHPGIVRILDAGIVEEKPYLAMEFIEGDSLEGWREAHRGDVRGTVAVLRDVARAVHHAHALGIMHRDLKPQNILVDGAGRPHVTDFGLAKTVGAEASMVLTAAGMAVGSPTYMSPEQARGLKSVDGRTDVWSVGVMLYELLAGRTPFQAKTPIQVLHKAVREPAEPPSQVAKAAGLPPPDPVLEAVCLQALAKKPEERQATAAVLADALEAWLEGRAVDAAAAAPTPEAAAASPDAPADGWFRRLLRRVRGWFRRGS